MPLNPAHGEKSPKAPQYPGVSVLPTKADFEYINYPRTPLLLYFFASSQLWKQSSLSIYLLGIEFRILLYHKIPNTLLCFLRKIHSKATWFLTS